MDPLSIGLGAVLSALLGIPALRLYERNKRARAIERALEELRERALESRPTPFLSVSLRVDGRGTDTIHDLETQKEALEEVVKAGPPVTVVLGKWGSGKSTVAAMLASLAVEKTRAIPLLIDASGVEGTDVESVIVQHLNDTGPEEIGARQLLKLIETERDPLYIFDGLDQLPASLRQGGPLDAILDFASNFLNASDEGSKCILVVREEFFEVSPALQGLAAESTVRTVQVLGCTERPQAIEFATAFVSPSAEDRLVAWAYEHWEQTDLREHLTRPKTLRLIAENADQLLDSDTNLSLGRIFELSVSDLAANDPDRLLRLEDLASGLFIDSQRHKFTERSRAVRELGLLRDELLGLVATGRLQRVTRRHYSLEHASLRDFLVARRLLRGLREGDGERVLRELESGYLVSEFLASLLERDDLFELMEVARNTDSTIVRSVAYDVLTELETEEFKELTEREVRRVVEADSLVESVDINGCFTATLAAGLGLREVTERLIEFIERVGIRNFLRVYFVTADGFRYYGSNYAVFVAEWAKGMGVPRYRDIRIVMAHVIGCLRQEIGVPYIEELLRTEPDDVYLQQICEQALRRIDEAGPIVV